MNSFSNIVFIVIASRSSADYSHIDDEGNFVLDYSQYDDEYELPHGGYPQHYYPQQSYHQQSYPKQAYHQQAYPLKAYHQLPYPQEAPQQIWEEEFLRATEPTKKRRRVKHLDNTVFMSLPSYQVKATPVSEAKYPWIAKVIHSPSNDGPYVCTAIVVEPKIFITAASCLYTLKVKMTRVHYQRQKFQAKAFVVPSKPTKQMFDDIGFIVVYSVPGFNDWKKVSVIDVKRTDEEYNWFANLGYNENTVQHKVIGYASKKEHPKFVNIDTKYDLTELDVLVDINMCQDILSKRGTVKGFYVPCYSSCTLKDFTERSAQCHKYHGTEGGAVYNFRINKLVGVATWGGAGGYAPGQPELPVGFSVPNSDNYFKDLACAKKIVGMKTDQKGTYQVC